MFLALYVVLAATYDPDPISSLELPASLSRLRRASEALHLGAPAFFVAFLLWSSVPAFLGLRLLRVPVSLESVLSLQAYLFPPVVMSVLLVIPLAATRTDLFGPLVVTSLGLFWTWVFVVNLAMRTNTSRRRSIAALLVGALLIRVPKEVLVGDTLKAWKVVSTSMTPALTPGDRLLANPFIYRYRFRSPTRGELVVYHPAKPMEQKVFVGRVMGLPKQTISIVDRNVLVDGEPVADPWGYWGPNQKCGTGLPKGPWRLGGDEFFVLMDNRCNGYDSRFTGAVPRSRVLGNLYYRYWPVARAGLLNRAEVR